MHRSKPQRLRRPLVDHEFKFRWLFDRKIGGLRALEDAVDIICQPPVGFGNLRRLDPFNFAMCQTDRAQAERVISGLSPKAALRVVAE